ncbi:MAG: efflux RND transporter periplasmic adaptor subunit [Fimbriimonas ginsengisoli]|uniref:Efflux RND transporter periplasmic adaptor subunit n=1 Tax=Fimbriimonas ginsengisoli TaxID=1005039 RepID=A0A931PV45_FIMGI|nr:efflux RND transporter periplasmic adaptor subunit [Fimbriimonas ginsengisoli]MBI3722257.1 efflux RND transporter periplasmic adaptor subunit [Fimbriimonas ginsengisoli]
MSLLALVAAGCVDRGAQERAKKTQQMLSDPTKSVLVMTARTQPIDETMEITGQVTTTQDSQVGAKQSGRLVGVYVRDGDRVAAGQLLAAQDATSANAQLSSAYAGLTSARSALSQAKSNAAIGPSKSSAAVAAAEAQLRSAKSSLAKAKAGGRAEEREQADWNVRSAKSNMETARRDLDRTQALYAQGAVPRQRLDQAQTTYDSALTAYNGALQQQLMVQTGARPEDLSIAQEAVHSAEENLRTARAQKSLDVLYGDQVQSAQAAVTSAQAQVNMARQLVEDTQMRAPFAGKISGKPAQLGVTAVPGQTVVRVVGGQGAYMEGQVPESSISKIKLGSQVDVVIEGAGNLRVRGSVAAIDPLGQEVGRLFKLRVQLGGSLEGVMPGMFARASVHMRTISDALVVPVSALAKRGEDDVVFIADGATAKSVKVTLGIRHQDVVQVEGLQAGQSVIVQGQEALVDGSPIKVEKSKTTAVVIWPSPALGG